MGAIVLQYCKDIAVLAAERSLHRHAVTVAYAVGNVGRRIEEVGVRAAQHLLSVLLHRFELLHDRLAGSHRVLIIGKGRTQGNPVAQRDFEQEHLHGKAVVGQESHLQHIYAVRQGVGFVALYVGHITVRSVDDALPPGRLRRSIEFSILVETVRVVARHQQPCA